MNYPQEERLPIDDGFLHDLILLKVDAGNNALKIHFCGIIVNSAPAEDFLKV